jgi:hypothetical protein
VPAGIPQELSEVTTAAFAYEPADRPTALEIAVAVEPLLRRARRLVLNWVTRR